MTIREMQERKKELGLTYAQIAERSGLPVGTVQKVLGGITLTPRYDTIMALESVLGEEQPMAVREAAVSYHVKRQGEYTLEDYYQFGRCTVGADRRSDLLHVLTNVRPSAHRRLYIQQDATARAE